MKPRFSPRYVVARPCRSPSYDAASRLVWRRKSSVSLNEAIHGTGHWYPAALIPVPTVGRSVFVIPPEAFKSKRAHVVILNDAAWSHALNLLHQKRSSRSCTIM